MIWPWAYDFEVMFGPNWDIYIMAALSLIIATLILLRHQPPLNV